MKLTEIAERIHVHLKRIEGNPGLNPSRQYDKALRQWLDVPGGIKQYYHAYAARAGSRVRVCYVAYQGSHNLTRKEALEYLEWLDSGRVGTHFEIKRTKA